MKDGRSAFPVLDTTQNGNIGSLACLDSGMTLRDYFAGQALVGIITSDCSDKMAAEPRAKLAYRIADAMLAEREKPTEEKDEKQSD